MKRSSLFALLLLVTSLAPVSARAQAKPEQEGPLIGTTEISVDVVVRDKRGRLVKDLTAADFTVREDGVAQDIASFRLVLRDEAEQKEPTGPTPTGAEEASKAPKIVAIVFDRLSLDARARSKEAALKFVDKALNPSDFVGVFMTDLSLVVLQPFTRDKALVRKAIEESLSRTTAAPAASTREQVSAMQAQLSALKQSQSAAEAAAPGGGGDSAAIGGNAAEIARLGMTIRSLESFEMLERNQQGYATTNGLSSIVTALGSVPGRKAVVFFAEGIAVTPLVAPAFQSVIANANRASVSFYTVDAAGLRAVSSTSETARELNASASRRAEEAASGAEPSMGSLTATFERREDLVRSDPNNVLGQLANGTGGFFVSGTNDPGERLRAVDEELRTHYAITYVPKNQNFDGQFRRVAVTVKNSDHRVQAREGYFAVNTVGALAVLPYEAKPLAHLDARGGAQSFPLRVAALDFPTKQGDLVPVFAEAPMNAFTFTQDQTTKTYKTDFAIVAVVKDSSQQVVRKLSSRYELSGPLDNLEAARQGNVLFYRETTLEPGAYTIEAIAYDVPADKASRSRAMLTVRPAAPLQMSSLVIVDRVEKLGPADQSLESPLRVGDTLLYPSAGAPLSKSKHKQMGFYAAIVGAGTVPTKATIKILQKGQTLAELPVDVPAPDTSGRAQLASGFPLDAFPPGDYEMSITVSNGKASVTRSTRFSVVP